ncbi:MAG TPA: diguanylate cyclase [Opitutaceae bacterium]
MERRILLIDDDRLQFAIVRQQFLAFRREKFVLEWASTYEEGLSRLRTGGYAACLLDYQLGERDGLELIHDAVQHGCSTPIIFLTAETSANVDIEAMNAGALDYLVKGEISAAMLERSMRYALKLGDTLAELKRLATHDPLTGLLNRRELDRILNEESERARRFGRPLSLVLIDVDHFKAVNDTYGHPAGDAVLREVSRRLLDNVREIDRLVRFGGEEIALVFLETDGEAAQEGAQRLVDLVRAETVDIGSAHIKVTISAGVASLPRDASSGAELLVAADSALYAAKRAGRDCVAQVRAK